MVTPLRFTLRQLQYFVGIVDHGTMAAAAQACLVSQSAISLAIGEFERELGVQLFLRLGSSRRLTLTQAGRQVLGNARRVLDQLDELQATARSVGQDIAGRLTVGCYPTLTPYILPRILQNFSEVYPSIELDFIEGSVSDLYGRLTAGECEVAVMYRIGRMPEFDLRPLYHVRPHIILPLSHRFAGREKVRLSDLASEPFIMLNMPPSMSMFEDLFAEAGVAPRVARVTTSPESVRALVAGGVGYSVLLNRAATTVAYDGDGYATAEIEEPVSVVEVVAVSPSYTHLTRRAQVFIEACAELFATRQTPGTTTAH